MGERNREELFLLAANGKTLDIGCTQGSLHDLLKTKIGCLYGCDITDKDYWGNKKNIENFKLGDIEHLPYCQSEFDTIIAGEIIEHCDRPDLAIKECFRVLKPNGILLLSTPNKTSWLNILLKAYEGKASETGHGHKHIFKIKELTRLLQWHGFDIETLFLFPYDERNCEATRFKNPIFYKTRKLVNLALPKFLKEQIVIKARKYV